MGLLDIARERAPIPAELVRISDRQWPDPYIGYEGREYRQLILERFLELEPEPRRHGNGQPVMSGDKARLRRAINDVADAVDTTGSNVEQCAKRMYHDDSGEHDEVIDRFLHDLLKIEDEWKDEK